MSKSTRLGGRRSPIRYGNSVNSSSSGSYGNNMNPFGAAMADSIFDVYSYDCEEAYDSSDYDDAVGVLEDYDMFDGETHSFHFRHQGELEIETNEEREARLKRAIERFERGYKKMAVYALRWHYLMEDLEDDEELMRQFKSIQVIRKLKGSTGV